MRALGLDRDDVFHIPAPSPPHEENDSDWENFDPQQDVDFGPYEDEFHYLLTKEPEAEPGQMAGNQIQNPKYPILEDDDDKQVVQIDEEAGRIY